MKKRMQLLWLIALCLVLTLAGCRRKPIETESETQSETEKATEKLTEWETETTKLTQPATERQSETKKETAKKTTKKTSVTPSTTKQTEAVATQMCPYCGNSFSTVAGADGSSPYSTHVAQEEAYINSQQGGEDTPGYQTGSDGNLYAQCPYCYQWFLDVADESGYSPYADHVAAESAYANQEAEEDYVQCPNCGNWVTPEEYQQHISNGW